ncbi:Phage tail-collar fibre protein [Cohaesibacter sp. ES.047]|uniref:phage tail protein n=1 Tax=Cohaesibacter sp. ES.047 TaxID=1798205 RepID=UPI000BB7852D|nr:phage tail protein [Cohaesibacter sp. ES.047]SNY91466.1 Phage tail-collar fibre protein [Cohaesibacter sp. ES.047]
MTTYSTRLTNAGAIALNEAITGDTAVALEVLAVGDANGADYVPDGSEAALINEQHRLPLASIIPHPANANWLVLEAVLPPDVGGWWIREVGVFDDNGDLFAIANFPPTYKALAADGSASNLTIQIVLQVSDTNALTLSVDAGEGYATPALIEAAYPWATEAEAADEATEHKVVDPKRLAHVLALLDAAPRDELQALSDAVDLALQGKADSNHNHDGQYYSEDEVDNLLSGKSDTSHSHSEYLTTSGKAADSDKLNGLRASEIGGGKYLGLKTLSSSGTHTLAAGTKHVFVMAFGGGGGTNRRGGFDIKGGDGGKVAFWLAVDGTLSVTIGAAGSSTTGPWATAGTGGTTKVAGVNLTGGTGAFSGNSNESGGSGTNGKVSSTSRIVNTNFYLEGTNYGKGANKSHYAGKGAVILYQFG